MLNTGTVPVSDSIHRLPDRPEGESELSFLLAAGRVIVFFTNVTVGSAVKGKTKAPIQEEDDEEEELKKLQAEMAM